MATYVLEVGDECADYAFCYRRHESVVDLFPQNRVVTSVKHFKKLAEKS